MTSRQKVSPSPAQGAAEANRSPDEGAETRELVAMQRDQDLGVPAEVDGLRSGVLGPKIKELEALGFDTKTAAEALNGGAPRPRRATRRRWSSSSTQPRTRRPHRLGPSRRD